MNKQKFLILSPLQLVGRRPDFFKSIDQI